MSSHLTSSCPFRRPFSTNAAQTLTPRLATPYEEESTIEYRGDVSGRGAPGGKLPGDAALAAARRKLARTTVSSLLQPSAWKVTASPTHSPARTRALHRPSPSADRCVLRSASFR